MEVFIYLSVNDVNPGILFGGTWEQIKDKFLLGTGDLYLNGLIGGEANHTLTEGEMPTHTHTGYDGTGNTKHHVLNTTWNYSGSTTRGSVLNFTGGNQAHNNMPPYFTCYIFKRIN